MFVTLDVSKLSGWLNADASCRESKGGHIRCGAWCMRVKGRKLQGWRRRDRGAGNAQLQRGGPDCRLGGGQRGRGEERTWNMVYKVVTLDVSKLSGWSNADADCRESKGGRTMRGEVRAWRQEDGGRPRRTQRVGESSTADWGQGTGRSARGTCRSCL